MRSVTGLSDISEISNLCYTTQEPVLLSRSEGNLVVMSLETFEKSIAMTVVYQKLEVAQKQLENGDIRDSESVFSELRKKYRYEI